MDRPHSILANDFNSEPLLSASQSTTVLIFKPQRGGGGRTIDLKTEASSRPDHGVAYPIPVQHVQKGYGKIEDRRM